MLRALLTGDAPHAAANAADILRQAAAGELGEALSRLGACDADPDLVAFCKPCLAPNPDDRPRAP